LQKIVKGSCFELTAKVVALTTGSHHVPPRGFSAVDTGFYVVSGHGIARSCNTLLMGVADHFVSAVTTSMVLGSGKIK
jgi:hypothetical protein